MKKTLETSPRFEGNWAPCGGRLSPVSLLKPHLLCLVGCVLNTDGGIKKTAQTVRHSAITGQSSVTALLPHLSVSLLTSSSFVQIRPGSDGSAWGSECSAGLNVKWRFSKHSPSCSMQFALSPALVVSFRAHSCKDRLNNSLVIKVVSLKE